MRKNLLFLHDSIGDKWLNSLSDFTYQNCLFSRIHTLHQYGLSSMKIGRETERWSEAVFIVDYVWLYTLPRRLVIFYYNDWVNHHIKKLTQQHLLLVEVLMQSSFLILPSCSVLAKASWLLNLIRESGPKYND